MRDGTLSHERARSARCGCILLVGAACLAVASWSPAADTRQDSGQGGQIEQTFKRLDRNDDGQLTREEVPGAEFGSLPEASAESRQTLEEFSKALAKQPLKFHPGTDYQYGHSIDILGRYLEVVSGRPLDELVDERILKPLRMNDTGFFVPSEKKDRIAQMYTQPKPSVLQRGRDSEMLLAKPTLFLGGQGLVSTASDYARFCQMMLNKGELDGVRVLKPETVEMMFANQLKDIGRKYGLGGAVDGAGGYSWGGAAGTQFWIDSKNRLFGIFMVQTQRYRSPAYSEFRKLTYEALNE